MSTQMALPSGQKGSPAPPGIRAVAWHAAPPLPTNISGSGEAMRDHSETKVD